MGYLILGGAAFLFYLWVTRGKPMVKRREWRFVSGAFAVVAFMGAAFAAIRSAWAPAIVLTVVGMWLASTTRGPPAASGAGRGPSTGMGEAEARRVLGVDAEASRKEIHSAYTRLMRMAHPDHGGTSGLASQLNAARDRLLGGQK